MLPRISLVLLLCLLLLPASCPRNTRADHPADVSQDVAMVGPMIGETTALVVKVDPARLASPDLLQAFKPADAASVQFLDSWTRSANDGIASLREITGGQPVYATIGIPLSEAEWPGFVFFQPPPDADPKQVLERLTAAVQQVNPVSACVRKDRIVAVPGRDFDVSAMLDALVPSPRAELDDAFQAVAAYPVQILLLPPEHVRRTIVELMPQLPRPLGGGASAVLTEGLVWAAFGLDPAQLRAELVIQSASEEAARCLGEYVPKMLQSLYDAIPEFKAHMPRETLQSLLALVPPAVQGDRVAFRMDGLDSTGVGIRLAGIVAAALNDRIRRETNIDKFKQILLAMHNYHDVYRMLPPRDEARDRQGKPGLSWRVHILPFVEERKLYEEFHLDEPWDSPHNKALIPRMPKVFATHRFGAAPGHTTFLAPAGEDSVFGGKKAAKLSDIRDGTSNTVVLVEVKPELAVPWTAPQDYVFDPAAPARGLQIDADGRFVAGLADGSVHQLRGDLPPEQLLRLFQKSDGQPVDWDAIHKPAEGVGPLGE